MLLLMVTDGSVDLLQDVLEWSFCILWSNPTAPLERNAKWMELNSAETVLAIDEQVLAHLDGKGLGVLQLQDHADQLQHIRSGCLAESSGLQHFDVQQQWFPCCLMFPRELSRPLVKPP